MKTKKPDIIPCFECDYGHYETQLRPYPLYLHFKVDPAAIISDVPHEVCDQCGDICFGPEGSKMVDNFKAILL